MEDFRCFLREDRFKNEFYNESIAICNEEFYRITTATNRIDKKPYAIKKVFIKGNEELNNISKELKIWANLNHDNVSKYNSVWIEEDDHAEKDAVSKQYVIFIQMDMYVYSLKEAINSMKKFFKIEKKQFLTSIPYYIACELVLEVLTGAKYLHSMNPPVLHRDISPDNILITNGSNNKFCKVNNFGIAVFHDSPDKSHTQMRGNPKYMAPEVITSRKYDTKADVYSIGVMIQELFNFDINANIQGDNSKQYNKLAEVTGGTMNGQRKKRPSCAEILELASEWALSYTDVHDQLVKLWQQNNLFDLNKEYDINTQFVPYFLRSKILLNKRT